MATWASIFASVHLGSVKAIQATTESAPAGAGEGLDLDGTGHFDAWLEADVGETLSGTGILRGYRYEPAIGAWTRMPSADTFIPDLAAGQRRVLVGAFDVINRRGRFALMADGVGVSAGGLTLYLVATRQEGGLR
jgi:hypothetical protein